MPKAKSSSKSKSKSKKSSSKKKKPSKSGITNIKFKTVLQANEGGPNPLMDVFKTEADVVAACCVVRSTSIPPGRTKEPSSV